MIDNYLEKLEFNKILHDLSSFCTTNTAKKLALSLRPSNKKDQVKQFLNETEEAVNLAYRNSLPSFYEIESIDIPMKKLKSSNFLTTKELLNLASIFKISKELTDYFNKDFLDLSEYPILESYFSKLYSNIDIYKKVFSSIIDENTIDEKASKSLSNIRKQKRKTEQDIRSKLNDIIHSSTFSKYIQENIVTIRNERFVIPVKEEYRTKIKGFIHDISNAGSTVFIEPISVFEMNNELNKLNIDEELEIEKILLELSNLFTPYLNELNLDFELICKLDFIFAKAKYSKSLNAITPIINNEKQINLINARHPLIEKEKVVPISINLGNGFSTLLITGPNTGGKTVTLKTVGLLTCMACSGLNIPCQKNSSIYVFDFIFSDIGDDQSISDSLSTFSSHMINIVEITKKATNNSLILVDELGSGTDPLEGANLAISILEYFKSIGSLTIATTHYQELKKYALITDSVENASVEFDINTLTPTYRLLLGIPGKSNAFEISKKLGLDNKIIKKAKDLLTHDEISFEELLKNIYDDKSLLEKEKNEITIELEKIKTLRKSLQKDNEDLKNEEKNLINNAKIKARNILLDAKDEADNIIKEMNALYKNSDNINKLNDLRKNLNSKIKNINLIEDENNDKKIDIKDIKLNTKVFVKPFNQEGIIISNISKSNEVQVQLGNLKTNVNIDDLVLIKDKKYNKSKINSSSDYKISKTKNIKTEINVIGLNVEEAIFVVDKFLDDCYLSKLHVARIVHGKGTGKLRNGIQNYLKTHPHVASFRNGTYGEGEMGVTVVELKK